MDTWGDATGVPMAEALTPVGRGIDSEGLKLWGGVWRAGLPLSFLDITLGGGRSSWGVLLEILASPLTVIMSVLG